MNLVLAIFGGLAVFHGLFMGLFLLKMSKGKNLSNLFLGGLVIAISLRIGKSIFYFLLKGYVLIRSGMLLGLAGKLSIGPFVWLYTQSMVNKNFTWRPIYLLHFIPAFFALTLPWLADYWPFLGWFVLGYRQAVWVISAYLALSWITWYRHRENLKDQSAKWLFKTLLGSTLVWISFVFQIFAGNLFMYSMGTLWAAAILYWIFYEGLLNPEVFKSPKRKTKKAPSERVAKELKLKLNNIFQDEKIYKDSSITLNKLSQKLDTPSYLISQVINSQYGKSFPEFVNGHRINEVKAKLQAAHDDFIKIEALAYEVGFNTPSAFYTAFKKETSLTPQEYKKQCQQNNGAMLKK